MIKLILSGFWVCVVTLLSTYGVIAWYGAAATAAAPPAHAPAPAPATGAAAKPKSEHEAATLLAGMESIQDKNDQRAHRRR